MVHFTLFGIPVYIRPSFWVVLAIFGGALSISSVEDLIYPALFVIAGFIAIPVSYTHLTLPTTPYV